MNKKINIQILSVEIIRFCFIFLMIMGVTILSLYNGQTPVQRVNDVENSPAMDTFKSSGGSDIATVKPGLSSNDIHIRDRLFHPIILEEAHRYEIDPALVKAIIMAESGYNPQAISKRGAKGLMQLMPKTAKALGVEDLFNPKQNIRGGVQYFKQLVNQFDGDIKLALAAYNAGSKKVRHYQGIPPFKTTRYYIEKVFKYYQRYKDQMAVEMDSV